MKNLILCEGSTDGILLQYFMRKVYQWDDEAMNGNLLGANASWFRRMKKGDQYLDIAACKGSSRLLSNFELILKFNYNATLEEAYKKVALVTDRDEEDTEGEFIQKVKRCLFDKGIRILDQAEHNSWITCEYESSNGKIRKIQLLLLVIPFSQTGAMETFLLECISKKDTYDAQIIEKGNSFIDNIDPQKKYLTKRRYITKAKFDVYFSVRTAADQFIQRQNILKDIEWERYLDVQHEFAKLDYFSV